jgi:hypothetical protein
MAVESALRFCSHTHSHSQVIDALFMYVPLHDSVGPAAVTVLSEIVRRNYVPPELEAFLLRMFMHMFTVLEVWCRAVHAVGVGLAIQMSTCD